VSIVEKRDIENNITKMYLFKIFSGVVFFAPVLMLFKEANGVSISEIYYLQIIFAMSMVLFEVPTGYFADIYGRKASMVVGATIQSVGIIAFGFAYGFFSFAVVEILMGFGVALYSGANSALVYESLNELGRSSEYKKIWGNMQFYNVIFVGISSVVGGVIADTLDMRYTIYASIPFYFMMVAVALSFNEPKRVKVIAKKGYGRLFFRNIKNILKDSSKLRWIVLYSGIILALNQSIYPIYQNYFELIELDLVYFGLVFASFQVVSAFSSKYAHKAELYIDEKSILIALPFMVAVSYLLMGSYLWVGGFLFIYLQQFVRGFRMVVINDYINKLVDSDHRATILSVESLFSRLILSLMLFVWGLSMEFISIVQTLQYIGLLALVIGGFIWYFIVIKRRL